MAQFDTFDYLVSIILKMNNLVVYNTLKPVPTELQSFAQASKKLYGTLPQLLSIKDSNGGMICNFGVPRTSCKMLQLVSDDNMSATAKSSHTFQMLSDTQEFVYSYLENFGDKLFSKKESRNLMDKINVGRYERLVETLAENDCKHVREEYATNPAFKNAFILAVQLKSALSLASDDTYSKNDAIQKFWAQHRGGLKLKEVTNCVAEMKKPIFIFNMGQKLQSDIMEGRDILILHEIDSVLTQKITSKADHMDCVAPYTSVGFVSHLCLCVDSNNDITQRESSQDQDVHSKLKIDNITYELNGGKFDPILNDYELMEI